jgi:hypothetical protein
MSSIYENTASLCVSGDFGQVRDRAQNVHNTNHQSPITVTGNETRKPQCDLHYDYIYRVVCHVRQLSGGLRAKTDFQYQYRTDSIQVRSSHHRVPRSSDFTPYPKGDRCAMPRPCHRNQLWIFRFANRDYMCTTFFAGSRAEIDSFTSPLRCLIQSEMFLDAVPPSLSLGVWSGLTSLRR